MGTISFEPLEKAMKQLEAGISQSSSDPLNDLMRDGVIQRFEFTMDLCWKLLQRYLKEVVQVDEASIRSKKDLFREAARIKIIADAEAWIGHYEARNETSHVYDTERAEKVFNRVPQFFEDAKHLLEQLKNAT